MAGCCLAISTGGSLACGYHGSLGDGFSAQHPLSIDVALAVRQAIDSEVLAKPTALPAFLALNRASRTLDQFREALGTAPQSMALLLVEAGLWTRYHLDNDRLRFDPHVSGPHSGDAVIVTAEPVVVALLEGRISFEQAIVNGLLVIADQEHRAQPTNAALNRRFRGHDN